MARPTKLTPELREKIAALVREGNYAGTAAVACGIAESTFYDWMRRGEGSKGGFANCATRKAYKSLRG
jgi:transposase-like protein